MPVRNISSLERSLWQTSNQLDSLVEQLKPQDPVGFCIETLRFTPTAYQRKVLLDDSKLLCLRWSRQSGKTVTICAKILWTATTKPGSMIGVVAPSLRQSKAVLGRIARLGRNPPQGRVESLQKTRISLTNGSTIEAFPNNPNTIRVLA